MADRIGVDDFGNNENLFMAPLLSDHSLKKKPLTSQLYISGTVAY